ncbi:MAG: hypothetical protein R2754_18055 [Microthrixaceae bacterium]
MSAFKNQLWSVGTGGGVRQQDRAQSTVEYALLVVGIATLALLVLAWASSTDVVGALFDRVFRWVTGRVG